MIRLLFTSVTVLFLLSLMMPVKAQSDNEDLIQFTGVIVTGDSLHPVPFSHIFDKTTGFGAISDYYGYFSFVARKSDTITFSAVGFKTSSFIIPDTIKENRYTIFQVMHTDTIYLNETVIYPWPTREQFKSAFLYLDIPDDDMEIARRNLEKSELMERAEAMPMDGSLNYTNWVNNQNAKLYYAGQYQPITILNPFAWAQFIKAWKEGKFKRKNKK